MTKRRHFSDAEILAQVPAARKREANDRAAGLRAASAWYDPTNGHIMMVLTNRRLFGVPANEVKALNRATPTELQTVRLSASGSGLHWDVLDVDLSVAGLLLDALGHAPFASALARVAGQAKSPAKSRAARANGAKGGRPRKNAA